MPIGFLLALQASGMVTDWLGMQSSNELAARGARLQQEAIEKNIQFSRIQTADESLQAMIKVRKNLGTQAVMYAARGVSGPMVGLSANETIGNFNADERMRKINQKSREAELRSGIEISKLHQRSYETRNFNEFLSRNINLIPTNPMVYKGIGSSFGLTKV